MADTSSSSSGNPFAALSLEGKVALITGAARGQGRSHAVCLAERGADVIVVDIAHQIETTPYPLATPDDLEETGRLVKALGRGALVRQVDVRDAAALVEVVADGVRDFGSLDIVCANAGVSQPPRPAWETTEEEWQDVLDVNLTGVWKTIKAAVPPMLAAGRGGSIVITASSTSFRPRPNLGAYSASKNALTGLTRSLALELAPHRIRVNTVNPTSVATDMFLSDRIYRLFCPEIEHPTLEDAKERFLSLNALPVPWVEPIDVSRAVAWLASDEARYVTGITLPVDAGATIL
jgi:(+)-trans-carveol dehydrogenase